MILRLSAIVNVRASRALLLFAGRGLVVSDAKKAALKKAIVEKAAVGKTTLQGPLWKQR